MNPQEFIDLHFDTTEKTAYGNLAARAAASAGARRAAQRAATRATQPAANSAMGDALDAGMQGARKWWQGTARPALDSAGTAARNTYDNAVTAGRGVYDDIAAAPTYANAAGRVTRNTAQGVGRVGQWTTNKIRQGLNKLDDFYHGPRPTAAMLGMADNMPVTARAGGRWGDRWMMGTRRGVREMNDMVSKVPGMSGLKGMAINNPLNPFNVVVGAGTLGAGYKGTQMAGNALFGGGSQPTPQAMQDQTMANNAMQRQMAMQMRQPGGSQGGGLWNSIPLEARYALGAGIPLMLAGGLMGGRGGMGLGALGLGAAGLGAAGAGYFGDGPRRLVGQGANALYNAFSSGANDPMSQIRTLGSLSPEFGTTAIMGRMPGVDSGQARGMYDMLTQNQDLIEPLLQQLQANSIGPMTKQFSDKRSLQKIGSDLATQMKQSRCWSGYEPVPGAKAYSRGSCRPVNSKKTQKEMKAGDKDGK